MRTRPILEASDITTIVAAAKAEAAKRGWNASIAIVNEGGYVLHVEVVGTTVVGGEVAITKARAAALTKRSTKELEDRVKDSPSFLSFLGTTNILQLQGGLPLIYGGECVGGIGVSGRPSAEDEIIAQAGVAALT
jgi:glc operon protein GlcG